MQRLIVEKGMKDLISKRITKCQRLNTKKTQLTDEEATRITGAAAEGLSCAQRIRDWRTLSTPAILLCPTPSYAARPGGSRLDFKFFNKLNNRPIW